MKPVVLFTREMPDDELDIVRSSGFDVIVKPLIKIVPQPADVILREVDSKPKPDAIVVTSKNGSKALVRIFDAWGDDCFSKPIYALGQKTAAPLKDNSISYINCHVTTGSETAKFIAEVLKRENAVIWHFCGNRSRKETGDELEKSGFNYVPIISYFTQNADVKDLDSLSVSAIAFYSPSAVQSYSEQSKDKNMSIPIFAIGPTTEAEVQKAGFTKVYAACEPTILGLNQQLKDYFKL